MTNKTLKNIWQNFKIGKYKLKDEMSRCISFSFLAIVPILIISPSILLSNYSGSLNTTTLSSIISPPYTTPTPAVTENVIIAVIDGVRYQETFGDPTHQYIPRMWNDLRPQGTIATNFWNLGVPVTTAGHQTIITGVWQNLFNNGNIAADQRTKQPNIFEYYRKQKNVPLEKTWIVSGKVGNLRPVDYSLHPDYGYDYRALKIHTGTPDPETLEEVKRVMDQDHPSLMLINFQEVDHQGHSGVYTNYTNAIKTADQVIYDLWQKIQADPYYKDKTTLIVTTDHGRHSDGFGTGFKSHGASTREDRHIIFLALGPDIRQNYVAEAFRQQIDIAPTVGALLGFKTPYAEGDVMKEILIDENIALNNQIRKNIKPKITADASGLHRIYHSKNETNGGFDIYYQKSADNGLTWSTPVLILESTNNRLFYEADIATNNQGKLLVFSTASVLIDSGGPSFEWQAFSRLSPDWGDTWQEVEYRVNVGVITSNFSLATNGTAFSVALLTTGSRFGNQQLTYLKFDSRENWTISKVNDEQTNILNPAVAMDGETSRVVWQTIGPKAPYRYWNIFDDFSNYSNGVWGTDRKLTVSSAQTFHYDPEISCFRDSGQCQLVWAKIVSATSTPAFWKIKQVNSVDKGVTWSDNRVISETNVNAWNPALTYLSSTKSEIVWEQHNGTSTDIYGRKRDNSTWGPILALTPIDGIDSVLPDITSYNGNVYISWQDLLGDEWVVKAKRID